MTATPNINDILKANPVNCSRGAPLGEASFQDSHSPLHLQQVRIPDGYAPDGTYWGIGPWGENLYCAFNGEDDRFAPAAGTRIYVRAYSRAGAKLEIFKRHQGVTFKR